MQGNKIEKFKIVGTELEGFQNKNEENTPSIVSTLLKEYNDEDRAQLSSKLIELEKKNIKSFKRILPNGTMPVYLSPLDPEKEILEMATWTQYSDVGPYADFDDNYCRPDLSNNNNFVYPRRNPDTQEITLENCNMLINTDIKEMADLNQYLSSFNDLSKVKLMELNSSDANSSTKFKNEIDKQLMEYNTLNEQYIQLTKLLQTNIDLINKRKKIIDDQSGELENSENDYNIKREIVMDDMNNTRDRVKLLGKGYLILKTLGVLFILIAVGLILLIDIGKIL